MFDRFDSNKDGVWSESECRENIDQMFGELGKTDPDAAFEKLMARYDLNKDGTITKEEYLSVIGKTMDDIAHVNSKIMSGEMTHEEVLATLPENERAGYEKYRTAFLSQIHHIIKAQDTNKDGFLDR